MRRRSACLGVIGTLLLAALPSGCTVGPDYVRPDTPLENKWDGSKSAASRVPEAALSGREAALSGTEGHSALAQWWKGFNDPVLDRLINEALESSLDLRLAQTRIRQARAELAAAGAAALPKVNLSASDARGRGSANVNTKSLGGAIGGNGTTTDLYKTGFDASWEIDLFGGVRRAVEAAKAGIEAAVEESRSVRVTLLGEVARNYIDLRGLQQELSIARNNLKSQQDTLELTMSRYKAGLSSGLDAARADSQAAQTASQIPVIEAAIKKSIYRIAVLLGNQPSALAEELSAERPVPAVSAQLPLGLPSELLLRRPDIRRAERELAVASAVIGVARSELFPRFNLTALVGLQSSNTSNLLASGSRAWQIAPGVSLPIFAGGRIRANIEAKKAAGEAALLSYRSAVLSALEEVEGSLAAYYKGQERQRTLLREVEADKLSVRLASERYLKGLTGFIDVLDAERSLYSSQTRLSRSETDVSTNLVALYKALGGGWQEEKITKE
ncbi:MAG: efflux transporter outer membrane subunit [Deltaproteobacteria bacterium]|nr:efflux transporter outer membrane subunit [Deltaproteobacteria bacterium]